MDFKLRYLIIGLKMGIHLKLKGPMCSTQFNFMVTQKKLMELANGFQAKVCLLELMTILFQATEQRTVLI